MLWGFVKQSLLWNWFFLVANWKTWVFFLVCKLGHMVPYLSGLQIGKHGCFFLVCKLGNCLVFFGSQFGTHGSIFSGLQIGKHGLFLSGLQIGKHGTGSFLW